MSLKQSQANQTQKHIKSHRRKEEVSKEDPKINLCSEPTQLTFVLLKVSNSAIREGGKRDCLQRSSIGCQKRMEHLISLHVCVNISSCGSGECQFSLGVVTQVRRMLTCARECKTVRNWKASEYYSKCKHSLALAGNPVYFEPLCRCQTLHFKSPCVCVCVYVYITVCISISKTCIHTCFPDNIKIVLVKCIRVHVSKWRFVCHQQVYMYKVCQH